jgi:hypothetical protein
MGRVQRIRSAITGRFIGSFEGIDHPDTTVVETDRQGRPPPYRLLLETYTARLHRTGALSVPPENLTEAINITLKTFPDVLEAHDQNVPGQP